MRSLVGSMSFESNRSRVTEFGDGYTTAIAAIARILVEAVRSKYADKIVNVDTLSIAAGVSRRVFQYRCQAAGVCAKECVRFVQCLRIVQKNDFDIWDPAAELPVNDPRTLIRVLVRAGFICDARPSLAGFLEAQRFISSSSITSHILTELCKQSSVRAERERN
jgi:hypothetical protein